MVIQPDGKIVAAGFSTPPVIIISPANTFWSRRGSTDGALVRYNADGSLDTTFNGSGVVETKVTNPTTTTDPELGPAAIFNTVLLQTDGKIVAGGYANTTKDGSFAITRYSSAGVIDPSFGTNGVAVTRMDTTTHADQYVAVVATNSTTITVVPNAQPALDVIADMYFVPPQDRWKPLASPLPTPCCKSPTLPSPPRPRWANWISSYTSTTPPISRTIPPPPPRNSSARHSMSPSRNTSSPSSSLMTPP